MKSKTFSHFVRRVTVASTLNIKTTDNMTDDAIRFSATVAQVKTMADGGIRITLDLPETAIETAAKMMTVRRNGAVLEVAAVAVKPQKDGFSLRN